MFFDHKTGRCTGELHRTTLEELEESQRLVDAGIYITTEHPSEESQAIMREIYAKRDMKKEAAEAEAWARKAGYSI